MPPKKFGPAKKRRSKLDIRYDGKDYYYKRIKPPKSGNVI